MVPLRNDGFECYITFTRSGDFFVRYNDIYISEFHWKSKALTAVNLILATLKVSRDQNSAIFLLCIEGQKVLVL